MKRIYKKEEGVSPVIATILMVAITVVLAATVYIMVAGYGGGSKSVMGSMNYLPTQSSKTSAVFQINLGTPGATNPSQVHVNLKNGTSIGTATTFSSFSSGNASASITLNSIKYTIVILDYNGNGKVDSGDELIIYGSYIPPGLVVILSVTGYSSNIQGTVGPT